MKKSETIETLATIDEIVTVAPEKVVLGNVKFAIVSYVVDGFKYVSKKSITVPLGYQVGDTIKMNPQNLNEFRHDLRSTKLILSMALIIRQPLFS